MLQEVLHIFLLHFRTHVLNYFHPHTLPTIAGVSFAFRQIVIAELKDEPLYNYVLRHRRTDRDIKKAIESWFKDPSTCQGVYGHISHWDTSRVTNMWRLFTPKGPLHSKQRKAEEEFNEDISSWDTGNVRDMSVMFANCQFFNQDLSNWNVTNVRTMRSMFMGCNKFNQDLSNWNVTNVKDMSYMFCLCYEFDAALNSWNVKVDTTDECQGACLYSWNVNHVCENPVDTTCMFDNTSVDTDAIEWYVRLTQQAARGRRR